MKKWLILLGVVVLAALGILFRVPAPIVEARAEPLPIHLPFIGELTNAMLTAWIVILLLAVISFLGTRRMSLVPSGLQNFLEWVVEGLWNLVVDVAGEEKKARYFFPIVATIFFFVLFSNWFELIPIVNTVGVCEPHGAEEALRATVASLGSGAAVAVDGARAVAEAAEKSPYLGCAPGEILVPLFRPPSADLNFTLALALISVVMTHVYGVLFLGPLPHFGKFFNVVGMVKAFGKLSQGFGAFLGAFLQGFLDFFVGILETISEIAKVISFSFRLFGNIFAGDVLLLVMPFLFAQILPLPFYGLELFVGLIQAFIFAVLTLAFMTMATMEHGHGEEGH